MAVQKNKKSPKKKETKKKSVKKKADKALEVHGERNRKDVNIQEADNGYIVNMYSNKGSKTLIARTETAAIKMANKMLKGI